MVDIGCTLRPDMGTKRRGGVPLLTGRRRGYMAANLVL
jgi:hypothetical protein